MYILKATCMMNVSCIWLDAISHIGCTSTEFNQCSAVGWLIGHVCRNRGSKGSERKRESWRNWYRQGREGVYIIMCVCVCVGVCE